MFSKTNFTKNKSPISDLFFNNIKDSILGKKYELSLVFIGDKKALSLNKKYRNKDYNPNILSFPISEDSGEIFINLKQLKKETSKFEMNYSKLVKYMFIHGCLHLKGLEHGDDMTKKEQSYLRKYS
jgi:probable rRNA maturation factor